LTTRIRTGATLLVAALAIFLGSFLAATGARANETPPFDMTTADGPSWTACPNLSGWDVNSDETDRKPTPAVGGLVFSGTDLIHHETDLALADLKPGSFDADPAPDQPSFFSVEITDKDGAYGTLRWNPAEGEHGEWDLVTNLGQFHHADPADFIGTATKWGEITEDTRVFTFGVGYTQNPPGTVDTTVSSVTFAGKTYDLTCQPATIAPTTPTTPATTAPTTPPITTSSSSGAGAVPGSSDGTGGTGALAVTGAPTVPITVGAVVLLLLGGGLYWITRRRRTTFQA
jgi:hypothetical protein